MLDEKEIEIAREEAKVIINKPFFKVTIFLAAVVMITGLVLYLLRGSGDLVAELVFYAGMAIMVLRTVFLYRHNSTRIAYGFNHLIDFIVFLFFMYKTIFWLIPNVLE